jgi:hypothetical protein
LPDEYSKTLDFSIFPMYNNHKIEKKEFEMNQTNKLNRLLEILNTMDLPELRKRDFNWLLRNLPIRNSKHNDFNECMKLLKDVIKGNQ